MNIIGISDIGDKRIDSYRNLRDRDLKREGLIITEGRLLFERLANSIHKIQSVLCSSKFFKNTEITVPSDVPVYVGDESLIEQIAGFNFHRGILAISERPSMPGAYELEQAISFRDSVSMVICPSAGNSENLGVLIRTSVALGVDFLVIGPESCDPYTRIALRAGMGAQFGYPIYLVHELCPFIEKMRIKYGLRVYATVLSGEAVDLEYVNFDIRSALLFGNEYDGIDEEFYKLFDHEITIPMKNNTDSLNLSVSAGIFIYKMTEKREKK